VATAPVSHQKQPDQNATNATEIKQNHSKINRPDRYPVAHNGLVAGSSPAGPTSQINRLSGFHLRPSGAPHQKGLVPLLAAGVQRRQTSAPRPIRPWLLLFNRRFGGPIARNGRALRHPSFIARSANGRPCFAQSATCLPLQELTSRQLSPEGRIACQMTQHSSVPPRIFQEKKHP
jgi:hypothetical protein